MQIRLPETYGDAREILENGFSTEVFTKGLYGIMKANPCTITHIQIHDKKDNLDIGTIVVDLTYKERVINKYGKFEEKKVVQTLNILTPRGDSLWPYNLVVKIWDGKYPTSVAVDLKRGVVYLCNIGTRGVELIEYAHITKDEVEALTHDLNDREPYKIKIDEKAMFDYISEFEGLRALRSNIFIEFDCGVRFKVHNNISKE